VRDVATVHAQKAASHRCKSSTSAYARGRSQAMQAVVARLSMTQRAIAVRDRKDATARAERRDAKASRFNIRTRRWRPSSS
jgi:hypothetical protein